MVQASEFVERTGRRALVTGASRGLGLEIGLGFARDYMDRIGREAIEAATTTTASIPSLLGQGV